jgi:hypothetical protein
MENTCQSRIRMASVFVTAILFFMTCHAYPQENQARLAAQNFLSYINSSKTIASQHPVERNQLDVSGPVIHCGWVMHLNDGGYILMSSSRNRFPVKAYSLENDYFSLPEPYRTFVEKELELYARIDRQNEYEMRNTLKIQENTDSARAWMFLLNWNAETRTIQAYEPDTALLTTTWNQGYPYNKFLPEIDGQKVLAGCVNVALAQVMKYHEYPEHGRGRSAYVWDEQTLDTILYHPYYWQNMPDAPTMATEDYLQDEVAILIRDLGIANKTDFGLEGSSASLDTNALIQFFGYSNTLSQMSNTSLDTFFEALRSQIDQKLPVLLSFPRHMVVVDGYASDPTGRKFHVNMGWGGVDNDYYYLDETVHTTGYDFSPDLNMIYDIKPCSGSDCEMPEPAGQDFSPQLFTVFQDMIIPADGSSAVKMRIDARDGNGDDIALGVELSNQDTISAILHNDMVTIQPLESALNKAVAVRISAKTATRTVSKDFFVLVADNDVTHGVEQILTGRFDSRDGVYTHRVILEGPCQIFADRGYSNQGFYISVRDSQGQLIAGDSDGEQDVSVPAIDQAFDFGLYTVSASLRSGTTRYDLGDHTDYMIRIDAPRADADPGKVADALGIDFSKISFHVPGDITGDHQVTLGDKMLILKILVSLSDAPIVDHMGDINEDGKIGIEDAVFWP